MQNVLDNLFTKALNREDKGILPKTNFTAEQAGVTYSVADALLTLEKVEVFSEGEVTLTGKNAQAGKLSELLEGIENFSKGTVELTDMFENIDGFVYEEDGATVCLVTSSNDRKIDKIYVNENGEAVNEKVSKAILYLDIYKDATGYGIKSKVIQALNGEIDEEEVIETIDSAIVPSLKASIVVEELESLYKNDLSEYFGDIPKVSENEQTGSVNKKGYVFKDGKITLFLDETNTLTINQPEEIAGKQMIQAMLLFDMINDGTGMGIKEKINHLLNQKHIELGSEEADTFIKLVRALDIQFYQIGQLLPSNVVFDENLKINSVLSNEAPIVIETIEEEEEEAQEIESENQFEQLSLLDQETPENPTQDNDVYSISARLKEARNNGYTLDEISDISTDEKGKKISISTLSEIERLTRTTVRQNTLNRIAKALDRLGKKETEKIEKVADIVQQNGAGVMSVPLEKMPMKFTQEQIKQVVQTVVKPVILEEEIPSMEEIQEKRPLVFEDDAIRSYLYKFEYNGSGALNKKEDFIEAVVEFRRQQREKNVPQDALLDIEKKIIYVGDPEPLIMGLINMMQGIHVLYTGPAGAGKTVLAQTISCILNMPLYTMNGNVDTDSDSILGSKEASNGSTYAVRGLMVKALENAGIFYGDEVNFILNEILSVANPALDHRKEVYNPNTHMKIIGHPNFRFIGSMNVGYQGTRDLNEATNDRFVAYEVDYMPESALKEYIQNYDPGYTDFQKNVLKMKQIPREDVLLIADIAKALQRGAKNPDLGLPQEVGSIRNINQIIQQSRNLPMHLAVGTVIQKYRKDPQEQQAIRGVLQSIDRLDIHKMKLNASDILKY